VPGSRDASAEFRGHYPPTTPTPRRKVPVERPHCQAVALPVALAAVLIGCPQEPFEGVSLCLDGIEIMRIDWGTQGDQRALGGYLASCVQTIGREITPGARIVFADGKKWPCVESAGGCYHEGVVYVRPIDRLWRSELCHELLHREFDLETGDADANHSEPEWGRFCGGGYLICDGP
jgi:hypothetical protein